MWSVYLDTHPALVTSTRVLGMASRRAFTGPLAQLRVRQTGAAALPGPRWVRVRSITAGIAADDLDLVYLAARPDSIPAMTGQRRVYLGREVVGLVAEVGPDVQLLRPGDRVVYQLDPCCATHAIEPPCRHCAAGEPSLCENRYQPGPSATGGGWSEEMIVHERQLFLVPDALSDEQAALLAPSADAVHAVLRALPQPGEHALVLGTATAGLLTIQAARVLAPNALLSALPTEPYQVELAARMGAARLLDAEEGLRGVAQITGARIARSRVAGELLLGGFDVIYDTLGTSESVDAALRWVRAGGMVVLAAQGAATVPLDLGQVVCKEIALIGAYTHGTETWPRGGSAPGWAGASGRVSTFALAAALMRERRLTPEPLVTHRFPLRDIRQALIVARAPAEHKALKVLLDIRLAPELADQSGLTR